MSLDVLEIFGSEDNFWFQWMGVMDLFSGFISFFGDCNI